MIVRVNRASAPTLAPYDYEYGLGESSKPRKAHDSQEDDPATGDFDSSYFAGIRVLGKVWKARRTLRPGAEGKSVVKVQEALVNFGLLLPKFGIDGIYGKETKAAAKDFQRLNSLPVTGHVNAATLEKLDAAQGDVPFSRRLCAVRLPEPCDGAKLEIFCAEFLQAEKAGKVGFGTCVQAADLEGKDPDSAGFKSLDTLWFKTTLPAKTCFGKFRVHHVANNAAGQIFHVLPPHNPDENWHRI